MDEEMLNEIEEENKANEIIEIDDNDEINTTQYDLESIQNDNNDNKKKEKKPSKWSKLSKKQKIIVIVVISLILLLIIGLLLYFLVFKKDKGTNKPNEPLVILEKDNYRYEDGKLIFIDENKKDLGSYECQNKNENLCYVAYYSNEDDFDTNQKVYEDGTKVQNRSDIILNKYAFVYDNEKAEGGEITLYNFDDEKVEKQYKLVKEYKDNAVIVKEKDNYGVISFTSDKISEDVKFSYDYIGYIEGTDYLVASTNKNYQLIDAEGKEISKTVPGEIKNYDKNNISVNLNGKYYVYNYEGKALLIDQADYIRFVESYIITATGKKLLIYDKDGSPMNKDGIRIQSSSYNTKLIFNEELRQTGKEEAFNVSINGKTMKIDYNDEYATINLNEGELNKNISYISYFSGKLYFYSDEEKHDLLGSYVCAYANKIESSNGTLENCFLAKESSILNPDEKNNNYLPIYNKRYVFIADTKSPNANDNIILWDLKNNKKLATYKSVDAGYHNEELGINFLDTAGTTVIAKNTSESYGLINIESSSISGLIPFKDKDNETTNIAVKKLNDYLVFERSDKTYHIYDMKGNELAKNVSTTSEIVEYKDKYIKVKSENGYYSIYSLDGKIVSNEYKYIIMDSDFYISVDDKNRVGVYKYDNKKSILEDEIVIDGKDYSKEIKYGLHGNILLITYIHNDKTDVTEINIG